MAATQQDLNYWFKQGVKEKCTHMIIVCDTFDYEDYPVYVDAGQDPHEVAKKYNGENMQRLMEVYDLRKPFADQCQPGTRVWNW